jgi:probable H4MPT-linked C1 transfer pathway protein
MINILGFDIGGVNIKGALLTVSDQGTYDVKISSKYYPMWLHDLAKFPQLLESLIHELAQGERIDEIGITMTAEVSDAYYTKKDGVNHILNSFAKTLPQIPKRVISTSNVFIPLEDAIKDYLAVASANWVATALYVGKTFPHCILIDIGSTTTDIIPILEGLPDTLGKTDTERLLHGELVYTGSLRSTIPSIVHKVPLQGRLCPISFEKFALVADVHLLLNHITEAQYTCDTADGRAKTKAAGFARLARIVCADINILAESELLKIAQYIYEQQLNQIRQGLTEVLSSRKEFDTSTPLILTGLGRDFLARKAAEKLGFTQIHDLANELGLEFAIATPAGAIAVLLAEKYQEL